MTTQILQAALAADDAEKATRKTTLTPSDAASVAARRAALAVQRQAWIDAAVSAVSNADAGLLVSYADARDELGNLVFPTAELRRIAQGDAAALDIKAQMHKILNGLRAAVAHIEGLGL